MVGNSIKAIFYKYAVKLFQLEMPSFTNIIWNIEFKLQLNILIKVANDHSLDFFDKIVIAMSIHRFKNTIKTFILNSATHTFK